MEHSSRYCEPNQEEEEDNLLLVHFTCVLYLPSLLISLSIPAIALLSFSFLFYFPLPREAIIRARAMTWG
jgi:hypothetical protein